MVSVWQQLHPEAQAGAGGHGQQEQRSCVVVGHCHVSPSCFPRLRTILSSGDCKAGCLAFLQAPVVAARGSGSQIENDLPILQPLPRALAITESSTPSLHVRHRPLSARLTCHEDLATLVLGASGGPSCGLRALGIKLPKQLRRLVGPVRLARSTTMNPHLVHP